MLRTLLVGGLLFVALGLVGAPRAARAEGEWEVTPAAEMALEKGIKWLAEHQGSQGNWDSNDLGLVGMGTLAYLSAGHMPGRGKYGQQVERGIEYMLTKAKPSGLLNVSDAQRDMYNHGLATFVLGQAHGMTGDPRISPVLDRALRLIAQTQCEDGGWDYRAQRQNNGHDLSLAVMQAKALRSAVDSGLEVPPEVIELAIRGVREHYCTRSGRRGLDDPSLKNEPGQFTYHRGGGQGTLAMAACGVVCLQEFACYDDWRIGRSMEVITLNISQLDRGRRRRDGVVPFDDAYALYYVGQALYQVGGETWRTHYPLLRDSVVESQSADGSWQDRRWVHGSPGKLYGTAVACFILSMPNRYLPILQEGRIESLRSTFGTKKE